MCDFFLLTNTHEGADTHRAHSVVLGVSMALAMVVLSCALLVESASAFVQPTALSSPPQSTMKNMLNTPHFVHQRRARPTRRGISMATDEAVSDGSDFPRVLWWVLCFFGRIRA